MLRALTGKLRSTSARTLDRERAALRRVAALVARDAPPSEVFTAVAEGVSAGFGVALVEIVRYDSERAATVVGTSGQPPGRVGRRCLLDGPGVMADVLRTGRPVRLRAHAQLPGPVAAAARAAAVRSAVGVPVALEGRTWGAILAFSTGHKRFSDGDEHRLADFAELVATAISSATARDDARRLAAEQAALRRLATVVAHDANGPVLFATVVEEVAHVLGVPAVRLDRYDEGRSIVAGAWGDWAVGVGSSRPLDGASLAGRILETAKPAHTDDDAHLTGRFAAARRGSAITSAVGVPIVVDGSVWGSISVGARQGDLLPPDTEARLADFAALVMTAISNAEARDGLRRLAEQQAALRRVATLVAEGASPGDVLARVAQEVAGVLHVRGVTIDRYEPDGRHVVVVASYNAPMYPLGSRWPLDGDGSLSAVVLRTGRPHRIRSYAELDGAVARAMVEGGDVSTVGVPVVVDGRLWGMLGASSARLDGSYDDVEPQLREFTELVATAISNSEARDELRRLAETQAALRRVATLVAQGATASELFSSVIREVAQVLDVRRATLERFEEGESVVVASWNAQAHPVGTRRPFDRDGIAARIRATGLPARIDDGFALNGSVAAAAGALGAEVATAGVPIVVDGEVWGMIGVGGEDGEELPTDIDRRLLNFTELVATAISNATARNDLLASRARIVASADEARRRIERDLHDGTQQRLIALGLDVQAVCATVPAEHHHTRAGLEQIVREIESVLDDVRELSRGVHPSLLGRGGLRSALRALARRSAIPVDVRVDVPARPPQAVEVAVYYVVSEALTNAARHSRGSAITVTVAVDGPMLRAAIADDGVGGATTTAGSGLAGLADRAEALGGRLTIVSPPSGGTTISVALPLIADADPPAGPRPSTSRPRAAGAPSDGASSRSPPEPATPPP